MTEAVAAVELVERLADRVRLVCRFGRPPAEPVAPAGLYHTAGDEAGRKTSASRIGTSAGCSSPTASGRFQPEGLLKSQGDLTKPCYSEVRLAEEEYA